MTTSDWRESGLYTGAAVRAIERRACSDGHLNTYALMERAGAAAYQALRRAFPAARRLAVVCGKGNNGGDGYVLARLAKSEGLEVIVLQVGQPGGGDAAQAVGMLHKAGLALKPFAPAFLDEADVIVDAVLGTGLSGPAQEPAAGAITAMNRSGKPILALDLPSGLNADTGAAPGACINATLTVTFVAHKRGLATGAGPGLSGPVLLAGLELPASAYTGVAPEAERLRYAPLPSRSRVGHKGDYGHLLCLGGELGMSGAVTLAARAALRTGAGLVSIATRAEHAPFLNLAQPELMVRGICGTDDPALAEWLARASVLMLGPGLGHSAWSRFLFESALAAGKPMVVDADGLNLLAEAGAEREDWVLTPHPGEAGRLLGITAAEVNADRFAAARALARRYGGVAVLKGAGTVIAAGDGDFAVCTAGNPGMASAGMGDVLAGVIGALLAQGLTPLAAARAGVMFHAMAGDRAAAEAGERGLLAGDLLPWLRRLVNGRLNGEKDREH